MKTLKTIAAAVVMLFGTSLIVPEVVAAKPSTQQTSAKSKVSSQSTKVVKKKKKYKKKYTKAASRRVAAVEAPIQKEPETSCFLFFCSTSEQSSSRSIFGTKPVDVASRYDGYTAQKNRRELKTFLSEPFDKEVDPLRIAWCAAFVNAVLHKSGYDTTDSLMARSFLEYGRVAKKPEEGDIVVLKRGRSKTSGHVGFFLGYDETKQYVKVLGGNQGKMVTTAYYPVSRVLGFRKPTAA